MAMDPQLGPAAWTQEDVQLDSQVDRTNDKSQGLPRESNEKDYEAEDDGKGSQDCFEEEENPREPVYLQEPGESSDAQARYINAFQEYTKKLVIYEKRCEGCLVRKRERELKQPSEDLAKGRREP